MIVNYQRLAEGLGLAPGAPVASAATIAARARVFHVTGTTPITNVLFLGVPLVTMIFDAACTATDGGNLKLAGNFAAGADDTLTIVWDGAAWFEVSRSTN